jgi:hypothetical protein
LTGAPVKAILKATNLKEELIKRRVAGRVGNFFVRQGEKRRNSGALSSIFNESGRKKNRYGSVPDLISASLITE